MHAFLPGFLMVPIFSHLDWLVQDDVVPVHARESFIPKHWHHAGNYTEVHMRTCVHMKRIVNRQVSKFIAEEITCVCLFVFTICFALTPN